MTDSFQFDTSYLRLSDFFYSTVAITAFPSAEIVVLNEAFIQSIGVDAEKLSSELIAFLRGSHVYTNTTLIAQAYAGHQFGHFNKLGDGRATLIGEHVFGDSRIDVQLKGNGTTPYSRRGDGKATLKSMLREYLMSEAMHALQIPTSRSLCVYSTQEPVYREDVNDGGVLIRTMSSHIRFGTFEYARYFGTTEQLNELLDYTVERHYPQLSSSSTKALDFFSAVMDKQIDLVVQWLGVGFIHGVMNTDNMSICGETFDYGPCAFMNTFRQATVFSSIDQNGRYAYNQQAPILKWNCIKLAEALLPLFHENEEEAIRLGTARIQEFDQKFNQKWYEHFFLKLGIMFPKNEDTELIEEWLRLLEENKLDFTTSFMLLTDLAWGKITNSTLHDSLQKWLQKWSERRNEYPNYIQSLNNVMVQLNPRIVARNYFVEVALENAVNGDWNAWNSFLKCLQHPTQERAETHLYRTIPEGFDGIYKTFCGT